MRLICILPLPPSTNSVYRKRGAGHGMYMTDAGVSFKELAAAHIRTEFRRQCSGERCNHTASQRFALKLELYFPDNRRADLDNRVKLIQDSLATALGFDDSQIDSLTVTRCPPDKAKPRCVLSLTTLTRETE